MKPYLEKTEDLKTQDPR